MESSDSLHEITPEMACRFRAGFLRRALRDRDAVLMKGQFRLMPKTIRTRVAAVECIFLSELNGRATR